MLAFLVCGLTLLFTPNGKFEDAIMFSRLEGFLDQKTIRDRHTRYWTLMYSMIVQHERKYTEK